MQPISGAEQNGTEAKTTDLTVDSIMSASTEPMFALHVVYTCLH